MNRSNKVLIAILVLLIGIQFIQPAKNNKVTVTGIDITKVYTVPTNVQAVLKTACYDCHSNTTSYPWYTYMQPMGWWMNHHITEGKSELNFSEFGNYSSRRQRSKLKSMSQEIEDDEMPLSSYTLIHQDAKLSPTEKKLLLDWIDKQLGALGN